MDFTHFADIPVIDGHIHCPSPALLDDILAVMETAHLARANLVAMPDLETINQNPALVYAKARCPERVTICGALDYSAVLAGRPADLAAQVDRLKAIGFDGLKLIEGKPMVRKLLPIPLDSPIYDGLWAALAELGLPVVFHVADPEEFWDPERCPAWAREEGWFYGDGTHPLKEALYTEVDHILARHPGLRAVFAHFYFLSADLPRAGEFLDAHPNVCFDLTPGVEMYQNFARNLDAAREFFLRYRDRLVYGSDVGASAMYPDATHLDMAESLGRSWVVRNFLETDEAFDAPAGVAHWSQTGAGRFHGIALPCDVLEKVYRLNFERLFGPVPAPLNRDAALAELERLAAVIDAQAGRPVPSPAREVAEWMASLKSQVPSLKSQPPNLQSAI